MSRTCEVCDTVACRPQRDPQYVATDVRIALQHHTSVSRLSYSFVSSDGFRVADVNFSQERVLKQPYQHPPWVQYGGHAMNRALQDTACTPVAVAVPLTCDTDTVTVHTLRKRGSVRMLLCLALCGPCLVLRVRRSLSVEASARYGDLVRVFFPWISSELRVAVTVAS